MPLGPCLHIFWSSFRGILPSSLSNRSSSFDCLTTSQGFLMSCVGDPRGTEGISEESTGLPLRRAKPVGAAVGPFDVLDCSWKSKKTRSPCLESVLAAKAE